MTRAMATAILFLTLVAASARASTLQGAVFPYPMTVDTLSNGLTVARVKAGAPGLVAYFTVVRVGSRNEVEPHHSGFAHFFEHMMFRGTKRFPEGEREKVLGRFGFDDNAFTTSDATLFYSFGPSAALKTLIEIEADRFQSLSYSEPSFQTEAKAVLGEYNKDATHPESRMDEVLSNAAFSVHPYKHTTIGFLEDIQRMPGEYEYSRQFFQRWYVPENVLLFVVGDFDDAQLMTWIRAAYGGRSGRSAKIRIPSEPPQRAARHARIDWETETLPREELAWHTPASTIKTPDSAIQTVLVAYLTGPTSPLYRRLVLDEQRCEQIGSNWVDHRDPSLFTLYAVLKDERHRAAVRQAFEHELEQLAKGSVDDARVRTIQSNLHYGLLMSIETADQIALALASAAAVLGVPNALDVQAQQVAQVKPAQLSAFVRRYLTLNNSTELELHLKSPGAALDGGKP